MTQSIPVSQIVTINPGVIGTGGNPLAINGVFVSSDSKIPVGQLLSFPSADSVAEYFGASDALSGLAVNYFLANDNSQRKPSAMIFTPYVTTSVAAWVRGTTLAGTKLTALQAATGNLSVTVGSTEYTAASVDLSQASSFSNAAELLTTALDISTVATVTWDAVVSCFVITTTETGADAAISAVTGTASAGLGFAGGVVSQGANVDTATTAMNRIKNLSLNWGTFTVVDTQTAAQLQEFAEWNAAQNKRYLMVAWDNDPQAITQGSETCFGAICKQFKYDAMPVYNTPALAAFAMGIFASVDWNAYQGRVNPAFKSQSGLATTCNKLTTASVLLANGYSYYGAYAALGDGNTFNFLYNGQLPGSTYKWADSYINQVFLNSQLQLAIISMMTAERSIPYNQTGYSKIRAACLDPIYQAVFNGTIQIGVQLSSAQKSQVISAIGFDVSTELYTQGWYLYIGDATAQTRGNRASPPITFLYMDGGSVQQITLNSIVIL